MRRLVIGVLALLLALAMPPDSLARSARGNPLAVPAPAAAVGYTVKTFGPNLTLGTNWFDFNFLGVTPVGGQSVQNGTGVSLPGPSGDTFSATVCTAHMVGVNPHGTFFGGGLYVEAVISFTPAAFSAGFPAFWADDYSLLVGPHFTWPGQAVGYNHWIELDFMQAPNSNGGYYQSTSPIDWYGTGSGTAGGVSPPVPNVFLPAGTTFSQPIAFGFLWVPATVSTQGYIKSYLNGVQVNVATVIQWNQYSAANGPPPVQGTTMFSLLDTVHEALIIGTNSSSPMSIVSVTVWQASGAGNLIL